MSKYLFPYLNILPPILYKYRNWDNKYHKDVLLKGQFYLSNPKSFEDEYDCNIPLDFESIKNRDIKRRYLIYSERNNSHFSRQQHKEFVEYWFAKGMLRNINECRKIEKHFFDKFDKQAGVLSLALKPDIEEMWTKYANNHKGFCVGVNFKQIRKDTKLFDSYGYVRYKKKLPSISPIINSKTEDDTWTKQISTKLIKWSFEKEYRIFKMSFKSSLTEKDRTIIIPPKYFTEIILGYNMDNSSKNEIYAIIKDKYPNIKIIETETNGRKGK